MLRCSVTLLALVMSLSPITYSEYRIARMPEMSCEMTCERQYNPFGDARRIRDVIALPHDECLCFVDDSLGSDE
jgi:hypothetical protein